MTGCWGLLLSADDDADDFEERDDPDDVESDDHELSKMGQRVPPLFVLDPTALFTLLENDVGEDADANGGVGIDSM